MTNSGNRYRAVNNTNDSYYLPDYIPYFDRCEVNQSQPVYFTNSNDSLFYNYCEDGYNPYYDVNVLTCRCYKSNNQFFPDDDISSIDNRRRRKCEVNGQKSTNDEIFWKHLLNLVQSNINENDGEKMNFMDSGGHRYEIIDLAKDKSLSTLYNFDTFKVINDNLKVAEHLLHEDKTYIKNNYSNKPLDDDYLDNDSFIFKYPKNSCQADGRYLLQDHNLNGTTYTTDHDIHSPVSNNSNKNCKGINNTCTDRSQSLKQEHTSIAYKNTCPISNNRCSFRCKRYPRLKKPTYKSTELATMPRNTLENPNLNKNAVTSTLPANILLSNPITLCKKNITTGRYVAINTLDEKCDHDCLTSRENLCKPQQASLQRNDVQRSSDDNRNNRCSVSNNYDNNNFVKSTNKLSHQCKHNNNIYTNIWNNKIINRIGSNGNNNQCLTSPFNRIDNNEGNSQENDPDIVAIDQHIRSISSTTQPLKLSESNTRLYPDRQNTLVSEQNNITERTFASRLHLRDQVPLAQSNVYRCQPYLKMFSSDSQVSFAIDDKNGAIIPKSYDICTSLDRQHQNQNELTMKYLTNQSTIPPSSTLGHNSNINQREQNYNHNVNLSKQALSISVPCKFQYNIKNITQNNADIGTSNKNARIHGSIEHNNTNRTTFKTEIGDYNKDKLKTAFHQNGSAEFCNAEYRNLPYSNTCVPKCSVESFCLSNHNSNFAHGNYYELNGNKCSKLMNSIGKGITNSNYNKMFCQSDRLADK
ncbi:hypothetical protein GJ496_002383 [Pomphorhynchus laevis]|nr:hypothetical protein GJ496_002383 [Pomphorhynchus laevis]